MKKSILFLLLIATISAVAQKYHPMLKENKIWGVITTYWYGSQITTTKYYKLSGDSLKNGISYKKIYCSYDSLMQKWYDSDLLVSEDTINQKVYLNNDVLLYNFSLKKNDTLKINTQWSHCIVDTVKQIMINNDVRKKIEFKNWNNEFWIEGIGSSVSPFMPNEQHITFDVDYKLLFVKENDKTIYHNPEYPNDYYLLGLGLNSIKSSDYKIKLYPQPAYSELIVELPNEILSGDYTIFNTFGQNMKSGSVALKRNKLDVNNLNSGVYYFVLKDRNHKTTQKFTIQR
ncbi:MAG: T9SS type A sorting domain-containing protein [Paludibacter sp.]|jgi:Secretion system C-terminal sorting domain